MASLRALLPILRTSHQHPHRLPRLHTHPRLSPLITHHNHNHHHTFPQTQTRAHSTTPKPYTTSDILTLTSHPTPHRLLIDVREPSELLQTGRIPGAVNMPLTSNPDAFYLNAEDFFDRFGFERPGLGASAAVAVAVAGAGAGAAEVREGADLGAGVGVGEVDGGLDSELGVEGKVDGGVGIDNEASSAGGLIGDEGVGVEEVIFYCKAGVRSRAAARMAREWEGVRVGDMQGGWMEWEGMGGASER